MEGAIPQLKKTKNQIITGKTKSFAHSGYSGYPGYGGFVFSGHGLWFFGLWVLVFRAMNNRFPG